MAGKSNKGRNRSKASALVSNPSDNNPAEADHKQVDSVANGEANGGHVATASEQSMETAGATEAKNPAEGEIHLYPVSVKVQSGEKLELQLSPGDSVMDIRQFLLDAPETCFFTCYDLILHTKDGSSHQLEDFNEISEIGDITTGGCFLEMVAALYDDRSIRSHLRRARELLSLSTHPISLSTSLALQHEGSQQKRSETGKTDGQEMEGLSVIEDVLSSLGNLVTSVLKDIKCIDSIVFSSFNPPPSYRRLHGDLIYIDATTLEGNHYCITGSTKSFYVNSSTVNVLDPKPSKVSFESSTLVGLLQKVSPKFKRGFKEILDHKASAHPFENVQSLLPPRSWLGIYPIPDYTRDSARAEEAFVLSYGSELIGMQRDWNEELQSCKEFPHSTPQERILRGRALYKVSCDFVDAAIKGAVGVINRCIPPINPTDPECFHMYVHNNIFFSFAVDSDFVHISKDDKSMMQESSNSAEENSVNVGAETASTLSTSSNSGNSQDVVEHNSDVSGEVPIADSEQATYASANNDLKGTKAYQAADVPGLYNLAMAIIDFRGYRVVAQSIIPGILQGDKSDSLLYGSVDSGKKICWNESFHSKVVEAAKHLHIKEHTVLDGSGKPIKLAAPVECKGIVGSDDRHYLLDLMRVTPRDSNFLGSQYRFCVLRPELIASFCKDDISKNSSLESDATKSTVKPDAEQQLKEPSAELASSDVGVDEPKEHITEDSGAVPEDHASSSDILFNPNVFTDFKLGDNPSEIAVDEALVKKVGSYLVDVVIPKFAQDLCSLELMPMDGQTLTDAFHSHGMNIRYLGKVADMVKQYPHLWDLFCNEIAVRSAKHVIKDILRDTQDHDIAQAIAHFFNCFFGDVSPTIMKANSTNGPSKSPKKVHESAPNHKSTKVNMRWSHGASSVKGLSSYANLTSDVVWTSVKEFAKFKYQFEVPDNARLMVKRIAVVRNLCLKIGVTVCARKYELSDLTPFQSSDILNLQPIVKHSVPVCSEASDLLEAGRSRLVEGTLNDAYSHFSEAFSLLQQITGPMHRDVATCCRYLALVLYHAGDVAGAIVQQHRELIINERCLGLDHPDTARSYFNMALFYHGLNQTALGLRYISRTLFLLSLSSGPDNPDVASTLLNVAMMHQDAGNMNTALRYLQEALTKNEKLLGTDHIQTAGCYHALAIAFNCMGAYKLSVQHETKAYDIMAKQLGQDDTRTKDSENWLKTFKLREQQVNTQKQKIQSGNSAGLRAIDLFKAHPDLLQAFQAAAAGSGNAGLPMLNRSLNAAVVGEGLPRGRGVDERAARATAEARKKAAARGLLLRQNAPPPTSHLINLLNEGAGSEAPPAPQVEQNTDSLTHTKSVTTVKNANGAADKSGGPIPVGLGTSLGPLDLKKPKSKAAKVAAAS